jgi:hypothetical protein
MSSKKNSKNMCVFLGEGRRRKAAKLDIEFLLVMHDQ